MVLALALALGATGCYGPRSGKIYSLADGRSGVVIARPASDLGGRLQADLPTGEHCVGSYGGVSGARWLPRTMPALDTGAIGSLAVLTCDHARTLSCTVARRGYEDFSFGACKDENGRDYDVFF